jgi:2-polyprenyl-3-methyl-5-hydroxy-6-metoxy-1,4-benzoquinol methylase
MFDERIQLYDCVVDTTWNNSHGKLIRLIRPGQRVLEIGCATGYVSAYLTRELQCEVVAIELNPEAAKRAQAHCACVIVGDIEKDAFDKVTRPFDVITFGDVLEHLVSPGAVLARARGYLAEDGYIVVSLPNIAHYSVRKDLLLGRFDYQQYGLLDRTHLRFFTLRTARQMLEEAGYAIEDVDATYLIQGSGYRGRAQARLLKSDSRFERYVRKHLLGLLGYQFVFKASPRPRRP